MGACMARFAMLSLGTQWLESLMGVLVWTVLFFTNRNTMVRQFDCCAGMGNFITLSVATHQLDGFR